MKYIATIALCLICATVGAADRYIQKKNIHGGFDIYKNGRYIGKTIPNTFGGYKYFMKDDKNHNAAPRYRGYSVPSQTGENSVQYFFNPSVK